MEAKKLLKQPWKFATYTKKVSGELTLRKRFAKSKNGDIDVEDTARIERLFEFDEKLLKAVLKEESHQISRELVENMYCDLNPL